MRKQPNFARIIAFLKRKGIDYSQKKRNEKRMGFTGYDHESYPVVSYARQNYTMDNQTFKFKSYIADKKG